MATSEATGIRRATTARESDWDVKRQSKWPIQLAKSLVRFEVALCRHSGVSRNPVFSIPRHAGLDPGFRRGDGSREGHYFWQLLSSPVLHRRVSWWDSSESFRLNEKGRLTALYRQRKMNSNVTRGELVMPGIDLDVIRSKQRNQYVCTVCGFNMVVATLWLMCTWRSTYGKD